MLQHLLAPKAPHLQSEPKLHTFVNELMPAWKLLGEQNCPAHVNLSMCSWNTPHIEIGTLVCLQTDFTSSAWPCFNRYKVLWQSMILRLAMTFALVILTSAFAFATSRRDNSSEPNGRLLEMGTPFHRESLQPCAVKDLVLNATKKILCWNRCTTVCASTLRNASSITCTAFPVKQSSAQHYPSMGGLELLGNRNRCWGMSLRGP